MALITTVAPLSEAASASFTVSPAGVKSIALLSLAGGWSVGVPVHSAPNWAARSLWALLLVNTKTGLAGYLYLNTELLQN